MVKVVYRDKKEMNFSTADAIFVAQIKEDFEKNTLFYIQIELEDGSMLIEFGDKCCNIQMDNEELGEIYGFINPDGNSDVSVDLWANSYLENMICYNIDDITKIILTYIIKGVPDSDYQWDISDM